jgi:D-glycero-alpha-D-manno-heptose 1-phosphate guanylyltransferase
MQAIILAGGLGTRLKTVINDKPKVLATISGKPFLYWLITYLQQQGITSYIFSLGYLHQQVEDFLKKEFSDLQYDCLIETEPLGTGGAIKYCLSKAIDNDVLILNGDTFFNLNIKQFAEFYQNSKSDCCIALTPMQNFDRYGLVSVDKDSNIIEFNEKKYCKEGLINTGVLLVNKSVFLDKTAQFPRYFSYEKDFLQPNISQIKLTGYIAAGYFIDIGIPEDYYKADKGMEQVVNEK